MIFSSTNQPVRYPSIKHLISIPEETIKGVLLNQPANELLLTWNDCEELIFPDVRTFVRYVDETPDEVYDSVMRLQKHLVLIDKQSRKLEKKFTNYKKANEVYIVDNTQLKAENNNLENQLANLAKQLENARLDKHLTQPSLPPPLASDDLDDNLKQSKKTKLTKLSDPPMLTDGHVAGFDIDVWESKMIKKLTANANHYPTKALRMTYINSCVDGEAYKHLAARLKIGVWKPFATVKEMFEVLQKAYGDVNQAHTTINKFRDLKITKNFNSFWAEFQVLASELDHNEATLISKLKYKLTPLLSWAMVGGVSQPKDIHEYVQQCQLAYQDLKDIELQTPAANFGGNRYNQETNTNTSTSTNAKTAGLQVNCNEHPANSLYSHLPSVTSNPASTRPARSKATRLNWEEIAKLQRKNYCFTCKEVSDHWPKCINGWRPISAIADLALARVNVSEMAVPQPGHIEAKNI